MKNATELVSIITAMYNAEKYIKDTIESVLSQTYTNWEMIIINDCSHDNSLSIAASYAKTDNRIRLIANNKNSGVSNARNRGITEAKGRYIAFLDSDDIWFPNKLEKQMEFIYKQGCAFCFSSFDLIDSTGKKLNITRRAPQIINYGRLLYSNPIGCLTVLIDISKTGIFQMPQIRHEDYACWLYLLRKGHKAYGIRETLASYRVSAESISANKFDSLTWIWNIYRKHLKLTIFKSTCHMIMYFIISALKYTLHKYVLFISFSLLVEYYNITAI